MTATAPQPGRLFVVAAPSGAGKTTLVHRLMSNNPELRFSVSFTTRPKRRTETEGRDYFFVSRETFATMVRAGDFLEHAEVFDNYYGTSKSQVEGLLNQSYNVILEIDWQGARQVREQMPGCRSIFILPPSLDELRRRLTGRGTDTPAVIERRFRDAVDDMSHWDEFDYVVINDDLGEAAEELQAIVTGAPGAECNATSEPDLRTRVAALLA